MLELGIICTEQKTANVPSCCLITMERILDADTPEWCVRCDLRDLSQRTVLLNVWSMKFRYVTSSQVV